jgi:membrane protein YdbS with pleckstrin-like domain
MALFPCRECGREISTEAPSCPHCGVPSPQLEQPKRPSPIQPPPGGAATFRRPAPKPTAASAAPAVGSLPSNARKVAREAFGAETSVYVDARLLPGEHVIYRPYLAPLSMLALPAFFALLVLVTLFFAPVLSLVFLILLIGIALALRLRYMSTEFLLTDRRILTKVGWLSHRSSEVLLSKVESINVVQGLEGRLFGYGSIVVTGTGGSKEVIESIDKPFDFYRPLQEQLAVIKGEQRPA